MLYFQIDPHSGIPVYRQIMDQIKYYVSSGTLKIGDQLPSIREMARQLHINPLTVVKAYSELEHEGVSEIRHGKGAYIVQTTARMSKKDRENTLRRIIRQLVVEATQMGADENIVINILRDEFKSIQK